MLFFSEYFPTDLGSNNGSHRAFLFKKNSNLRDETCFPDSVTSYYINIET